MNLALITVGSVIALRIVLFYLGRPPQGTEFMLVHFLAVATLVFFTCQRMLADDPRRAFPDMLRNGFKNAAVYAVIFGVFILIYYKTVEPDHFTDRVATMVAKGVAEGEPEAIIRPRLEKFFTPFNYASMTFFTLLIVAGFNALAIGLLHHKVLRRFKR